MKHIRKLKRSIVFPLVLCLLLSLLLGVLSSCAPAAPFRPAQPGDHWTVGFGKAVITPQDWQTYPYTMGGYGINNPVEGVLDDMWARAVYLDDNTGRGGVLLISLDCIGLLSKDVDAIRARIDVPCRAVHVMFTHTHAAVDTLGLWGEALVTGRRQAYFDFLADQAAAAAKAAYAARTDGQLLFGQCGADDLQRDSRPPVVYSRELSAWHFVPDDSSLNTLYLVHFSAHPGTMRSDNRYISADYPYFLGQRLAEHGADFLFINGAIGAIGVNAPLPDQRQNCMNTGYELADLTLSMDFHAAPAEVNDATESYTIRVDNDLYKVAAFLNVFSANVKNESIRTQTSLLEIGGILCVLVPGELFPEIAYGPLNKGDPPTIAAVLSRSDFLVFGLADEELGYILPPTEFVLNKNLPYIKEAPNHYHETNSVGPTAAARLITALQTLQKRCGV
ncbi:MAG: hypothetical protein FWF49_02370 [Oscillospiraceae bacterium]|nr:hypothetical protein [Oscillospiraceae bacterium]